MDLKAKEEEKTKKKSFLGVLRKISFRTRKTSKEEPSSPPTPSSPACKLIEKTGLIKVNKVCFLTMKLMSIYFRFL